MVELREGILKGDNFEMLARIYSEDPGAASRGGDVGTVTKDMMVEPFAKAMSQLKPGQVSGVVETEYGFHLIQMIDKTGSQYHVRHILIKPQDTQNDMEEPYDLLDSVSREIKADNLTKTAFPLKTAGSYPIWNNSNSTTGEWSTRRKLRRSSTRKT